MTKDPASPTPGRTSLIVSHKVVSLSWADRILVLDGGKVIEQGSRDELRPETVDADGWASIDVAEA